MGRKRKRSKQNAGPASSTHDSKTWPDHIVDELLSYLNSQIAFLDPATDNRRERHFEDVEQEVTQRLNSLCENGEDSIGQLRTYTTKQIRSKLSQLYATRRRTENDNDDWTIIYMQGFACLDWTLDKQREERMARRAKEIEHTWRWEFLHSPRKTRAGSQANGTPQAVSRKAIRAASRSSNARNTVRDFNGAGSPSRLIRAIDDVLHVSNTEPLATEDGEDISIKTEHVAQKPFILVTSEHDNICRPRPPLRDSQEISESENEALGTPLRGFSPAGCGDAASDGNITSHRESPSTLRLKEHLHAVEKELQTIKRDTELEIDFWKAEYCKAQHDRSRWKKAKDVLAAKLNTLQSAPNRSEVSELSSDALVDYKAALDKVLNQRDSHVLIQNLKRETDREPSDGTISKVSKLMQSIGGRLQAALRDAKFLSGAELRTLPRDHPLGCLVEQAFGVEGSSAEATELLEHWHERPWLRQYGLLALCGAALSRWVLQQSQADILFDRYQDVGTRSSTSRYREAIQLVANDDPKLARNVDLMVHKNLAKDDCFEHFQRAKGNNLARKLQEVLAPLCELDPDSGNESDVDSGVDGYAISHLSDVFFSAIDVQCRLVLTGRRYECAWHEPGAVFDETSMSSCKGQKASAADTQAVRLTLLPGINQITASRISIDFGGFADQRHRDHEEVVCLVRAVVVCGSPDLH